MCKHKPGVNAWLHWHTECIGYMRIQKQPVITSMRRIIGGLVGIALLSWVATASATSISGDIIYGNSWSQAFNQDNSGTGTGGWPPGSGASAFDQMVITVVGGTFEAPGVNGLSGGASWTGQMLNGTTVLLQGADTTSENFTLHWTGSPWWTQLNLWTYSNGNLVCAEYFTPGWVHGWLGADTAPQVPDGGLTAMLLGLGVLSLTWVRRTMK